MTKKQKNASSTDKKKMFRMSDAVRSISIPSPKFSEHDKMNLVKERFKNIDEDDLMGGQEFFDSLDSEDKG